MHGTTPRRRLIDGQVCCDVLLISVLKVKSLDSECFRLLTFDKFGHRVGGAAHLQSECLLGLSSCICVRNKKEKKPACSAGPPNSNSAVVTSHLLVETGKDVRDESILTVGSRGIITKYARHRREEVALI